MTAPARKPLDPLVRDLVRELAKMLARQHHREAEAAQNQASAETKAA